MSVDQMIFDQQTQNFEAFHVRNWKFYVKRTNTLGYFAGDTVTTTTGLLICLNKLFVADIRHTWIGTNVI